MQVIGEERQRLKGIEVTEVLGFLGFNDEQQILGTDAIFAGLVQTGLVAQNHAWQQLHINEVGADALRSLVAAQEVTHAVTGAVSVGHRLLP